MITVSATPYPRALLSREFYIFVIPVLVTRIIMKGTKAKAIAADEHINTPIITGKKST
jgi:hypothetical protein